jgi:group I intron endonuclease
MKYYISGHIQSGIYKITNKINKKYYIGSAYDLYKRYKDHRGALEGNRHHNKQLTRFVNKYGIDNLEFDLLEECSIEELESREQYYITNSKNIFNETLDVKACNRGKKLSEEHKQNISKSKIGKPKQKIQCPHCNKIGGFPQMKQWHFDKCRIN